eukprot:TRINITY_DN6989_c0_g1_i5.p1 TRINITY_DN6989_c0_g1~~TRINITY_DN6989_c0_g1_i5.p1  ORF type:complete len:402 (-),score=58.46 TRINITY_DN6989_c0_g1_i5:369-1517(-)
MASPSVGVQEEILKTRMCSFHLAGRCSKGSSCTFAHHKSELRPKLNLFKSRPCAAYVRKGHCNEGDACRFAHGSGDLRAPLPAREAEDAMSCSDDGSDAASSRKPSKKESQAKKTRQQQQQPPVQAVDPSQFLASALSMQMPQAWPTHTRVLAIMMPPQPVFAPSAQPANLPFASTCFPDAPYLPFQFGVAPQFGYSCGASVQAVQGADNVTAEKPSQTSEPSQAQTTEVLGRSMSPPLPSFAISSASDEFQEPQNAKDFDANAQTPDTTTSFRSLDGDLLQSERKRPSLYDVESVSSSSESEGPECVSPRSGFEFGIATPTSSCDYPLRTDFPADDFWLRADPNDQVYEKHTFLHVAPTIPAAARRSRSSPCSAMASTPTQ